MAPAFDAQATFEVQDRIYEGQHIRQYPGALAFDEHDSVKIHAKQYIPRSNPDPSPRDPTFIIFHAAGFHKELYEPFMHDLTVRLDAEGVRPRSLWVPDEAYHGDSALLNDQVIGDDPHWHDHARDVLAMVQTFKAEMRQPIVGLAHSMGADQAVFLSHFHPRLFSHLVLLDPSASHSYSPTLGVMLKGMAKKPDSYPSRSAATRAVQTSPVMKRWDVRAQQKYIETAFKPVSDPDQEPVTEKTTKHAEIRHIVRLNDKNRAADGALAPPVERTTHPDIDPRSPLKSPFYVPGTRVAFDLLPHLRPPTLFLLGEKSLIVPPDEIEKRLARTGTGVGGSGGVHAGSVQAITVAGGHFLPMTNPTGTAQAISDWLPKKLSEWTRVTEKWHSERARRSLREIQTIPSDETLVYLKWDGKDASSATSNSKL